MASVEMLTRELVDEVAADVARGIPLEAAFGRRGVLHSAQAAWFAAGQSGEWNRGEAIRPATYELVRYLAVKVTEARAEHEAWLTEAVHRVAKSGDKNDSFRARGAMDILTRHPYYRQRWGQQAQVQGSITHSFESHTLPALPPGKAAEMFEGVAIAGKRKRALSLKTVQSSSTPS